ncbi:glucagon receptor isoform X1 [Scophthalmus maximus]|uniref:Glucagon receptor a n=2 Tax=Scophthalmus maximus TaxID=52904 RepID=A0A8D2ZII8_SCOMX|nr:glucagon receptor isoform X1 [Scophthalmus maximus]XP_035471073.1 glucagon receptor isoform X1 [Scophthalmus maximus]XP_035471074.1 glucagon receptor isoform X1 [Scophthalmus maximus]
MSRLLLLLAVLVVSCSVQVSPAATLDKLKESLKLYMEECDHNNSQDPPSTGLVCNRTFDNYACWPDGLPNTTVSVPCPWYLPWHHEVLHGMVYQECDANGQWLTTKNTSECDSNNPSQQYYGHIRIMYTVGYSLSLVALVLALGILICFRKLHCMRNNIHMNLFASFILRALSILIKDALLVANITSQDLGRDQEQGFPRASLAPVELLVNNDVSITVSCRIAVVMMQYSIMANTYWLLVEGIYLHNLLVITVFTERNYFKIYLCIGWGTPLIFLVPWVMLKYLYENQECWGQNIDMNYWWIIRSPILLAVVINFLIFIYIIKILVSKLRAHQMRYTDYKIRLAKSTLTLIPLLGIHQVVFIFVTDESTKTTIALRLTKLFIDLFFSSFQGLLVAILYCFVNKEVQSEILKKWKRWKLGRNIEEEYRHTYSNTPNTKTASLLNHVSRLPHLPDIAKTSAPVCSPEERHMLVAGCHNGMVHSKGGVQCASPRHKGNISNCTLVEDISLTDKVQCYKARRGNAESHL